MKHLPRKILQTTVLASGLLLLNACGGGGSSAPTTTQQPNVEKQAIETIMAYAESDGKSTAPTVQDYATAGIAGIDPNNVDDMNQVVENLTPTEVDSKKKLQVLADGLGIDGTAPVFTSSSSVSASENQTSALTLIAKDSSTVTYSIGGIDASSFTVNSSSGVVRFKTAPNYEDKNSYTFTATATDSSSNASTQTVTINIVDIDESGNIEHNGITYGAVVSPYSGRVWLDKNLGASQVCTKLDDEKCYGDYYQWGRNADGHENSNSTTTPTLATNLNNAGNKYITSDAQHNYDWAYTIDSDGSLRQANWSNIIGNSVCPSGFRVPTLKELEKETLLKSAKGTVQTFKNFLRVPFSGERRFTKLRAVGTVGKLWTSSASGNNSLAFDSNVAHIYTDTLQRGMPIRCIQNY